MASETYLLYNGKSGSVSQGLVQEFLAGTGGTTAGMPVKIGTATAGSTDVVKCVGDTTPEVVVGIALETVSAGSNVRVEMATADSIFAALPDDTYTGYSVGTDYGLKVTTCKPDSADTTGGMFRVLGVATIDGTVRLLGTFVPTYRLMA